MDKYKIGIVGYGTIGKRVADAILKQDDMELVGVTGRSYNWRIELAHRRGFKIYSTEETDKEMYEKNNIPLAGTMEELCKACDIIVDCAPKPKGAANKEKYYVPLGVKAIFQGGEKAKVVEVSFNAHANYKDAIGKQFVRVVSCNTTGLARTLGALDKKYGVVKVHATMIRRGADPVDIRHGPINAIVPVLEAPSHHGPDVRTVLYDMEIFTTAISCSTTLMHMHNVSVQLKEAAKTEDVIKLFRDTDRVMVVTNDAKLRSTAEIMEMAKDMGRNRGDMYEICVWREAVGCYGNDVFFMQAVHQESDVVPENIDCIRAMMGVEDAEASMKKTNESLGIGGWKRQQI